MFTLDEKNYGGFVIFEVFCHIMKLYLTLGFKWIVK